jgi:hypothetical protein
VIGIDFLPYQDARPKVRNGTVFGADGDHVVSGALNLGSIGLFSYGACCVFLCKRAIAAQVTDSRRGAGEKVIGITTVFSGDGQYLLANNTQEVSAEQYLEALTGSLQETVAELRSRFG